MAGMEVEVFVDVDFGCKLVVSEKEKGGGY